MVKKNTNNDGNTLGPHRFQLRHREFVSSNPEFAFMRATSLPLALHPNNQFIEVIDLTSRMGRARFNLDGASGSAECPRILLPGSRGGAFDGRRFPSKPPQHRC